MAEQRYLDYGAPESTDLLNTKLELAEGSFVCQGLDCSKGSGSFDITIGAGAAVIDGVLVEETEALTDQLTLEAAHPSLPRYDTIYMQYQYQPTSPPPAATFGYLKGTPSNSPTAPQVGANQVKLAEVYIPAGATEISNSNITNADKWVERKREFLRRGRLLFYGAYNNRPPAWRYPYIAYLALDYGLLLISDGTQWIQGAINVISGLEEERPTAGVENRWYYADDTKKLWRDNGSEWELMGGTGAFAIQIHGNAYHDPDFLPADQRYTDAEAIAAMGAKADNNPLNHDRYTDEEAQAALAPALAGKADCPHGNECHNPDFATVTDLGGKADCPHGNECHTENYLTQALGETRGWLGALSLPDVETPTGTVYWGVIGPIAVTGTAVKIFALRADVASAPSGGDIVITFKRNGSALDTLTISAGNTSASKIVATEPTLSEGDVLQIDLPDDTHGAKGLDVKFMVKRVII